MIKNNENKYYHTESLNLASYLLYKGNNIVQTEVKNKVVVFYFLKNNDVFESVNEYNTNSELKKFIACFKDIRYIAKTTKQ